MGKVQERATAILIVINQKRMIFMMSYNGKCVLNETTVYKGRNIFSLLSIDRCTDRKAFSRRIIFYGLGSPYTKVIQSTPTDPGTEGIR